MSGADRSFVVDLKGHEYSARLRPCATFMVVHVGHDSAKVECMTDDFCELHHSRDMISALGGALVRGGGDAASGSDGGGDVYDGDVNLNARGRRSAAADDSDDDDTGSGGGARKPKSRKPAAKGKGAAKPKARKKPGTAKPRSRPKK